MLEELYLDRARAGSFGSVASQYDRYRATYPDALIDDLAAPRPAAVLDVGCGTGKVAVALAERGLSVLGVEPDDRMAQVAVDHGIDVEVAAFETWDAAGRTVDLVTCGEAWHWIDPALAVPKLADVVAVGGTVARFWTSTELSRPVIAAFEPVYREHAPEVAQVWRPADTPQGYAAGADPVATSDAFTEAELWTYPWHSTMTTEDWVGRAATISDHQRLGPARLAVLLDALRATIDGLGGVVHPRHETYVLLNRRV